MPQKANTLFTTCQRNHTCISFYGDKCPLCVGKKVTWILVTEYIKVLDICESLLQKLRCKKAEPGSKTNIAHTHRRRHRHSDPS